MNTPLKRRNVANACACNDETCMCSQDTFSSSSFPLHQRSPGKRIRSRASCGQKCIIWLFTGTTVGLMIAAPQVAVLCRRALYHSNHTTAALPLISTTAVQDLNMHTNETSSSVASEIKNAKLSLSSRQIPQELPKRPSKDSLLSSNSISSYSQTTPVAPLTEATISTKSRSEEPVYLPGYFQNTGAVHKHVLSLDANRREGYIHNEEIAASVEQKAIKSRQKVFAQKEKEAPAQLAYNGTQQEVVESSTSAPRVLRSVFRR